MIPSPPPESVETRDAWRDALDQYLARRERIRQLRLELQIARTEGLRARQANRLRRANAGNHSSKETTA